MTTLAASPATAEALELLDELFAGIEPHDLAVRLWDGTRWTPPGAAPEVAFTLVVNHPSALRRVILAGDEAALAGAYLGGDLDLEGDIFAVPPVGHALVERHRGMAERARLALHARRLPNGEDARDQDLHAAELHGRAHSIARDREASPTTTTSRTASTSSSSIRAWSTAAPRSAPRTRTSRPRSSASSTSSAGSSASGKTTACSTSAAAGARSSSTPPGRTAHTHWVSR